MVRMRTSIFAFAAWETRRSASRPAVKLLFAVRVPSTLLFSLPFGIEEGVLCSVTEKIVIHCRDLAPAALPHSATTSWMHHAAVFFPVQCNLLECRTVLRAEKGECAYFFVLA